MKTSSPQPDELSALLIALTDGDMDREQFARLQSLLAKNADAQRYFRQYMRLCAFLEFERAEAGSEQAELGNEENGDSRLGGRDSGVGRRDSRQRVGAAVELPLQPDVLSFQPEPRSPNPEPLFSIPSLAPRPSPLSSPFVGGPVFSYMVATLIVGMMLLGAWAYKISHVQQQIVQQDTPANRSNDTPEWIIGGRITGMAACQWSDPSTQTYLGASFPLGRRFALASGLLEITYNTGARVILQGPCTYRVESRTSGFLALGKLTARVAKKPAVRGQPPRPKTQDLRPQSEISKFCVRTPMAIVTDLGTEFGVEVGDNGETTSHVYRGTVKVQIAGNGEKQAVVLHENETARVNKNAKQIVMAPPKSIRSDSFVRWMPQRARIDVFNTGVGLKEGADDPHWQIVAVSNDPKFKPRSAVVAWADRPSQFRPNDPASSQWISTADQLPDLPDDVTYTFRTTFELADYVPGSAKLRIGFLADNHVQAVRLNGKNISVPEHGYLAPFFDPHWFSIDKWFVEGANTLEFDVLNGVPGERTPSGISPMALLVELEGSMFRDAHAVPVKSAHAPHTVDGKEGR